MYSTVHMQVHPPAHVACGHSWALALTRVGVHVGERPRGMPVCTHMYHVCAHFHAFVLNFLPLIILQVNFGPLLASLPWIIVAVVYLL